METKARALPGFELQLPKLTTRKVWVGIYSEMNGTFVMIFNERPTKCPTLKDYNSLDPHYASCIAIEEWEHWFGTVQPFIDAGLIEDRENIGYVSIPKLDCTKVIAIKLKASWNEHGQFIGLNPSADH